MRRIFLVNRQSRGKKLGEINLFFLVSGSRIKNTRNLQYSTLPSSPPTKREHGGGDTFQANRSIEFTMSPSLSAVFLALNDGNEPYYNERLSNSGVFPTRGSRLLPPHTHLASATSTSSTSQPRDFIISSRPPDHRNSPLLFLV